MNDPQHPPLSPIQHATACAVLGIVIAVSMGAGYRFADHDRSAADVALQATRQALHASTLREDSLKAASTARLHRDSLAWLGYVQQVRAAGHDSLQAALSRASRRAGAEVAASLPQASRLDEPFKPHPGDIPEERPACTVELSCSQAADLLANDSLMRRRQDSAAIAATVASATCSTAVLSQRLRGDSLAAQPPITWKARALDAAAGAGLMATVFALLGIVW